VNAIVQICPAYEVDTWNIKICVAGQIRLYRVRWFFEHLEFNLTMSLLWVTLIRNLIVRALFLL